MQTPKTTKKFATSTKNGTLEVRSNAFKHTYTQLAGDAEHTEQKLHEQGATSDADSARRGNLTERSVLLG